MDRQAFVHMLTRNRFSGVRATARRERHEQAVFLQRRIKADAAGRI